MPDIVGMAEAPRTSVRVSGIAARSGTAEASVEVVPSADRPTEPALPLALAHDEALQ